MLVVRPGPKMGTIDRGMLFSCSVIVSGAFTFDVSLGTTHEVEESGSGSPSRMLMAPTIFGSFIVVA